MIEKKDGLHINATGIKQQQREAARILGIF